MIKERILQIAENKGIAKEKFFQKIGMTYGNFKGIQKKTSVNSDALDKIISIYPDISPEWLLSGKGDMFKSASVKEYSNRNDEGEINKIEEPAAPYNIRVYDREKELLEQSINDLRSQLNDKERIINMMEKRNRIFKIGK